MEQVSKQVSKQAAEQAPEQISIQGKEALKSRLATTYNELVQLYKTMTPEQLAQKTAEEGWTVQQTLIHLAIAEAGMINVAKKTLEGQPNQLPPDFDLNRYNQRSVAKKGTPSVEEMLTELQNSRAATLEFIDSLTAEQLQTPAQHALYGLVTVGKIVNIVAGHQDSHLAEIKGILHK